MREAKPKLKKREDSERKRQRGMRNTKEKALYQPQKRTYHEFDEGKNREASKIAKFQKENRDWNNIKQQGKFDRKVRHQASSYSSTSPSSKGTKPSIQVHFATLRYRSFRLILAMINSNKSQVDM